MFVFCLMFTVHIHAREKWRPIYILFPLSPCFLSYMLPVTLTHIDVCTHTHMNRYNKHKQKYIHAHTPIYIYSSHTKPPIYILAGWDRFASVNKIIKTKFYPFFYLFCALYYVMWYYHNVIAIFNEEEGRSLSWSKLTSRGSPYTLIT